MKRGQNVCLDESQMCAKMGHVWSKTRSLSQMLEKPCICSRGHIFSPIVMKHGLNVCFVMMKSQKSLKMGHVRSKIRSLCQILEKPCVCSGGHICCSIIIKLDQTNVLGGILESVCLSVHPCIFVSVCPYEANIVRLE